MNNENKAQDPSIKNDQGFVGLYQMGVPASTDGGLCNPPVPQNNNWKNCDFAGPLAKKLGLTACTRPCPDPSPGYLQYTTGPQAAAIQAAVAQRYTDVKWARMIKNAPKILDYINKTYNGLPITKDSILAMSHLLGEGGVYDFLLRNVDGHDANGTSGTGYTNCFLNCLSGIGTGNCKFNPSLICGGKDDDTQKTSDDVKKDVENGEYGSKI